ncbi:MAG: hypothetical protein ABSB41_02925 [Anaerolineales bacterium]|jgi:hypothetical protein
MKNTHAFLDIQPVWMGVAKRAILTLLAVIAGLLPGCLFHAIPGLFNLVNYPTVQAGGFLLQ